MLGVQDCAEQGGHGGPSAAHAGSYFPIYLEYNYKFQPVRSIQFQKIGSLKIVMPEISVAERKYLFRLRLHPLLGGATNPNCGFRSGSG
jgi:hypothetical protein